MKVAFIGTGSMGGLLIEAFLRSGALHQSFICISNRSQQKAEQIAGRHPGVRVVTSNVDAARESQIIFLCVKPLDFPGVLSEIKDVLTEGQIIVSITSPVQIEMLERAVPSRIAKIVPSITHSVQSGASLCIYGSRIQPEDRLLLEQLMSSISTPLMIKESQTRIASDISSCGPAFIAFILQRWAETAAEMTSIDRADAISLGAQMLLGTGKLLTEGGLSPEELQRRVAVPGGITAEGIAILDLGLQDVFSKLIDATHQKYNEDLDKLDILFNETFDDY
ncbi:late competence protein ComER [Paenibacillus aceti]|uniref:Pyrroline-5-carboxylate reductase n=1 Tax=Paenibacillus aceti TaxID=1820010 RepID=A0ABQ1VNK4_9BACL|nr:late competence protein ComER [Paenibacillus aceti]GGF83574.1 pyrroline-5-carboxylate reductase [Paenibacillus aceti]